MSYSTKAAHNACPVCGLPRGKGPHEFAHGKCMEIRAVTDGKQPYGEKIGRGSKPLTLEQHERAQARKTAKNYKSGKLPSWMYS